MQQHEYVVIKDSTYDPNKHADGVGSELDEFLDINERRILGFERARRGNERYWVIKLMKEKTA